MRYFSFVIIFLMCSFSFTSCDKVSKADSLRKEYKFEEAAKLYEEAASNGNSYAKWRLSKAYSNADGVELDLDKAKHLLEEAANEGCEEAKCDVALSYMFGWNNYEIDEEKGKSLLLDLAQKTDNDYIRIRYARNLLHGWIFEQDKEKAEKLLESVKDKNNPLYLRTLAEAYLCGGDKIEINYKKALELFQKAYEQGSSISAYLIASLYCGNDEIEEDFDKEIEWLKKGVEANSSECMLGLGKIFISDDSVLAKYHDVNKGLDLIQKAAKHGSGEAYTVLGNCYYFGENVNKDDDKAYDNYKKAYKLRDAEGAFRYAFRFIKGRGKEKDILKGIEIWKDAAEYGSAAAANNLYCYYYGIEYESSLKNLDLSRKYLIKAANLNSSTACTNIGRHYYFGSDLFQKDIAQSFIYYKKAADMGDIDACGVVAYFYDKGIGTSKDPQKAKEYRDKTKAKEEKE